MDFHMLRVCTKKLYEICSSVIEVVFSFFGYLFFGVFVVRMCYFLKVEVPIVVTGKEREEKKDREEKSTERVSNHCISNYIA